MSGIMYDWRPLLQADAQQIQELESKQEEYFSRGNFKPILQSESLFWAGAHRSLSFWDPEKTQDRNGFSLKDPVEKIRVLLEKNSTQNFSFYVISRNHIFIQEAAPLPEIDTRSEMQTVWPTTNPDGCAPPRIFTTLCPEKDQTLLKDIIPDLIRQSGASSSVATKEHRHISFDGREVFLPVDIFQVHW
jgi:hypothetical protein